MDWVSRAAAFACRRGQWLAMRWVLSTFLPAPVLSALVTRGRDGLQGRKAG